jgi:prepilin-type N-terminal cleavage/methylation domain-containing protein
MLKTRFFKKGFTLIEQLVAVGVLALVLIAGSNLFFSVIKSKRKVESLTSLKQTGEFSLKIMSNMLKNATEIVSACDEADTTAIEFKNPDGNTTEFVCDIDGHKISSNSAILVSDYVTDCSFNCDDAGAGKPPVVAISFTLEKGTESDILSYYKQTFSTTVSLRKY